MTDEDAKELKLRMKNIDEWLTLISLILASILVLLLVIAL